MKKNSKRAITFYIRPESLLALEEAYKESECTSFSIFLETICLVGVSEFRAVQE